MLLIIKMNEIHTCVIWDERRILLVINFHDKKSNKFIQLPECLLALAYDVLHVYTHTHTYLP